MKSKRILVIVFIGILIMGAVYKLKSNKALIESEIDLAQRKVDKIAVSVDSVHTGILGENIVATGTLEASEVLTVVSETQGKIVSIFKEKGDKVNKDDVIAKVDDEVIAANVLTAEANYSQFEKDIDRLTRLSEENAITKRDLEQANIGLKKAKADLITARKALSNTRIKAPISGYINNDYITTGQFLGGGSPVCEIVNTNSLILNIKVTENEVYKMENGQAVTIHLSAFPDEEFTGHITSIAEKADMAMKFNVEIKLTNDYKTHLRSGLYAEVILPVQSKKHLLINKMAIVGSMEKPVVYVVENGKAKKREIICGQGNNGYIEVLRGLSKDNVLIVSGQLNINDGDNVRIVN